MLTLGFLQNLNWIEILALLALGVLLFGKRLPEVGRSLGKGIVEFKKGLKGIGEEIEQESERDRARLSESQHQYRPPLTPTGEDARVSQPAAAAPPAAGSPGAPSN